MNPIFTKMVDTVEAANAAPDDYINSADGLKYCVKCRTPKEAFSLKICAGMGWTSTLRFANVLQKQGQKKNQKRRKNSTEET